ncbi:MAG: hypothetical protein GYB66_06085 [Chloroflexi bacterium]|nr:hypothetical protein [Chloroflexota bacterium]
MVLIQRQLTTVMQWDFNAGAANDAFEMVIDDPRRFYGYDVSVGHGLLAAIGTGPIVWVWDLDTGEQRYELDGRCACPRGNSVRFTSGSEADCDRIARTSRSLSAP